MNKNKEDIPVLDLYRETLIETRLKVLSNLETCIKTGSLDSTEALNKLATILLLNKDAARRYADNMGHGELWKRAL